MIKKNEFAAIDDEVKSAVNLMFDHLFNRCRDWTYILFLADAEYQPELEKSTIPLNPHSINCMLDIYKDKSRINFLVEFLRSNYSFDEYYEIDDNEFRIHLEMMIYSHIWESTPFLKKLRVGAHLSLVDQYLWHVDVPEMSKHKFIREEIRDVFIQSLPAINQIISMGFHSQIRNAFAHSDYSIDMLNPRINLENYKGKDSWEMEYISYNDWTKRFTYSVLFNYYFIHEFQERRNRIQSDFGKTEFEILLPRRDGRIKSISIEYDPEYNRFCFLK